MTSPAKGRIAVEEAIAYGLLAVIGLYAFVVALRYGLFLEDWRVGPGLVPAVVGGLVGVISVWQLVGTLRGKGPAHDGGLAEIVGVSTEVTEGRPLVAAGPAGRDPADEDVDIFGRTSWMRGRQLVTVFIGLIVAVALVPLLGLLVSFFFLSLFISTVVEHRRWLPSVIVSFVSVAVVYLVFVGFLRVPLPTGLIGIGG
jgi:hypothetical protein